MDMFSKLFSRVYSFVHVSKDGEVHDVVMYECNIIGRDSTDLPF